MAQPGPGAYEERRTDFRGNAPTGPSAFAQHMAGADILSDSATMYADTQESSNSSDGEWQASGGGRRRPDFGGSADGSGLAKPKESRTSTLRPIY